MVTQSLQSDAVKDLGDPPVTRIAVEDIHKTFASSSIGKHLHALAVLVTDLVLSV
jgi:glutamine synthetase adenylyltransferase